MLFGFFQMFDVIDSTVLGSTVYPSGDTNRPE